MREGIEQIAPDLLYRVNSDLSEVLKCILKGHDAAFAYYARLSRVREFVLRNYSEQITLARAAKIARMGKTYFSYFFGTKVGMTFREFVSMIRVLEAVRLMKRANKSITEVALAVGFNDVGTFGRNFRKFTPPVILRNTSSRARISKKLQKLSDFLRKPSKQTPRPEAGRRITLNPS